MFTSRNMDPDTRELSMHERNLTLLERVIAWSITRLDRAEERLNRREWQRHYERVCQQRESRA